MWVLMKKRQQNVLLLRNIPAIYIDINPPCWMFGGFCMGVAGRQKGSAANGSHYQMQLWRFT